ncbi:MAG: UbiD family decarboxylase, partial [Desulfuromonadales bacterium]|nr:UbiD family decarboxylase [Desulfuromonadales bacterium]
WSAWQRQGKRMPVVLALGGAPALTWAASAPLPRGVDELAMVGLVTGSPVMTTACDSCDLEVPAGAEFILEGYLAPGEFRPEGPFGNHTGYYAPAAPAPVFHLLSLRRRPHPLYPCTVVGPPPRENYWLAKASERLLLPLLQLEVPEVVELCFLPAGIFHRAALVSVSGGEGPDLLHRLRQTPLLRGSRLLVLFDADDDLHDGGRLLWLLLNQASPGRDWLLSEEGIGIDARRRGRPLTARVAVDPVTAALVERRWGEYGID